MEIWLSLLDFTGESQHGNNRGYLAIHIHTEVVLTTVKGERYERCLAPRSRNPSNVQRRRNAG